MMNTKLHIYCTGFLKQFQAESHASLTQVKMEYHENHSDNLMCLCKLLGVTGFSSG